jgi:hypothetical protein
VLQHEEGTQKNKKKLSQIQDKSQSSFIPLLLSSHFVPKFPTQK